MKKLSARQLSYLIAHYYRLMLETDDPDEFIYLNKKFNFYRGIEADLKRFEGDGHD